MRGLSLFGGIGGIDLGLERAGMEIVGQCEIEPFPLAVLAKHWPNVWRHDDVKTITGELVRRNCGTVDLIAFGAPCQDNSLAGKGAGIDGKRSGLFWEALRLVREVQPGWILFENVPGLINRGLDRCLAGLDEAGYKCQTVIVGADDVGAPHRRKRLWIVGRLADAPRNEQRRQGAAERSKRERVGERGESIGVGNPIGICGEGRSAAGFKGQTGLAAGHGEGVGDAGGNRGRISDPGRGPQGGIAAGGASESKLDHAAIAAGGGGHCWPAGPGKVQHAWEAPRLVKFPVGGFADGLPVRLVRFANRNALKAYGNAVVPQIVELIGRWIMQQEAKCD